MGLIFCDSFDHLNAAYLQSKWTSIFNYPGANQGLQISTTQQRTGAQCGAFTGNGAFVTIENTQTWIHGAAFNFTQYGGGVAFTNIGGIQVQWTIQFDGTIAVFNGPLGFSSGTKLGQTDPSVAIVLGRYYYIEFKSFISQSDGTVDVRINGQVVLSLTSVNTSPSGANNADGFTVTGPGGNAFVFVDDLYVCDTNGVANTDFLGDVAIGLIMPASDGDLLQWTPSSGTAHFSLVNEIPPDGDASFVSAIAPGAGPYPSDSYYFQTVSTNIIVLAIQTNILARKNDTGNRALSILTRYGAATSVTDSSGRFVNETYIDYRNCFDVSPLTTDMWTPAVCNATQWGYQLIA